MTYVKPRLYVFWNYILVFWLNQLKIAKTACSVVLVGIIISTLTNCGSTGDGSDPTRPDTLQYAD